MTAKAERPIKTRRFSTVTVRVPASDWSQIIHGRATEFRTQASPSVFHLPVPVPAILYRTKRRADGEWDSRLMMLEGVRSERLGSITDEGLEAAGYEGPRDIAFPAFRRDWVNREHKAFEPMRRVVVFTVRQMRPGDAEEAALRVFRHLYEDYIQFDAQ